MSIPAQPPFDPRLREMILKTENIVEAGWNILREIRKQKGCYLSDKECFFAGAAYLFDAVLHSIGPEHEPTEDDLALMSKLHRELMNFNENFSLKVRL